MSEDHYCMLVLDDILDKDWNVIGYHCMVCGQLFNEENE